MKKWGIQRKEEGETIQLLIYFLRPASLKFTMEASKEVSAEPIQLGTNIVIQPPLSRCGRGPGLILLRPASYEGYQQHNTSLDPEPRQKWAEESFAIAQVTLDSELSDDQRAIQSLIQEARKGLAGLAECTQDDLALLGRLKPMKPQTISIIQNLIYDIVYGSKTDYASQFELALNESLANIGKPTALICFDIWDIECKAQLIHAPGPVKPPQHENQTYHQYPDVPSAAFVIPGHSDFKYATAGVSHTRSLAFLKKHLRGPYFDLEKIWEEHTYFEFGDRSVEKTMATMVQEPYVNHVPTVSHLAL